jgi:hypothetical protein
MALNLEKTLQDVKKEIEALNKKLIKLTDSILKEKKPAKKTPTKKTAVKKKTVIKKKVVAKKKVAKKIPAKKAAPKKKTVSKKTTKKTAEAPTAFDTVIGIISKSKKGVDTATLIKKTGFDAKKVANIIYKAKKRKLVKSSAKGVYVKA